jgi:hypothetical protein
MHYYFHPIFVVHSTHQQQKMNEYYDSEEEVVPATYKIEPAKSGRSTCAKSKELIPLGELRVGWYDKSERIRNYRVRLLFFVSLYHALYLQ